MNFTARSPASILIADENNLFREGLAALLNSLPDFTVVGQADLARRAVDSAIELKPDIVLMDIVFSDGSGIEAIPPILSALPETKVGVLTMSDSDEYLFTALRCGAMGYILKNIPLNALVASVRALVRGEAAISRSQVTRVVGEFYRVRAKRIYSEPVTAPLTRRELEVIRELARGSSNREIADHLTITENTAKRHIHNILKKLGLRRRREIAAYARRQGW
jgi:two-component system NarL family response regulator